LDAVITRYEIIDARLNKLANTYSLVSKQASRLYGQERIAA
jgi:hypothetical protein